MTHCGPFRNEFSFEHPDRPEPSRPLTIGDAAPRPTLQPSPQRAGNDALVLTTTT
jgi:hypothetical protein